MANWRAGKTGGTLAGVDPFDNGSVSPSKLIVWTQQRGEPGTVQLGTKDSLSGVGVNIGEKGRIFARAVQRSREAVSIFPPIRSYTPTVSHLLHTYI
jgi:hypothetical protein